MSCESWKWLAISTGTVAFVGHFVYLTAVGGYPMSAAGRDRHPALRPFFVASLGSGLVAILSVVVYLLHCTD